MSLVQWSACRHCGARFRNPAFDLLIGEQDRAAALGQFGLQLAQHVYKVHPEIEKMAQVAALQFSGMMRMIQFDHQSAVVNETALELLTDIEDRIPRIREMITKPKNTLEVIPS